MCQTVLVLVLELEHVHSHLLACQEDESRNTHGLPRSLTRAVFALPCRIHAADVLQTVHMVCTRGGLRELGVVEDLSVLACYLAAVVHDFEHKGVNNDYLVGGDCCAGFQSQWELWFLHMCGMF